MSEIPERVDVYVPDGGFATVPRDSLKDVIDVGGSVVKSDDANLFRESNKGRVVVYSPDNQRATIPRESLADARKENFRVASYDEAIGYLREKNAQSSAPPKFVPGDPDGTDAYDMREDNPTGLPPVVPPTAEESNLLAALNAEDEPAPEPVAPDDGGLLGSAARAVVTGEEFGPGSNTGAVRDELVRQEQDAEQVELARQAQLAADADPSVARREQARADVAASLRDMRDRQAEQFKADAGPRALEPGNIDLANRPRVKNADGSISTVRSMGVNIDGKEYLIPTVSDDGRVMGDDEAVEHFKKTGKHLGVYASPEESTAAAEAIHNSQALLLDAPQQDISLASVGGEAIAQGASDQTVIDQAVKARELELQAAEEARQAELQRRYGADLSLQGVGNAANTVAEGFMRSSVGLGLDAPMAYAKAGADQASAPEEVSFDQSLETAKANIAGHREANPMLATASEIAGYVVPALATGGQSTLARTAARAPAGWLAGRAAQLGLKTAGVGGRTLQLMERPGLAGALARVGVTGLKVGAEGAVEGSAQGAATAVNDLWLSGDAKSAWEYVQAGVGGLGTGAAFGGLLGGMSGVGISGGSRLLGNEAEKSALRSMGLSNPDSLFDSTMPGARSKGTLLPTPAQAATMRENALPMIKNDFDELLRIKRALDTDPSVPQPMRPKKVDEIRLGVEGARAGAYKQLQPDLDELVGLSKKLEVDPSIPRPLAPEKYDAALDQSLKGLSADMDEFLATRRELRIAAEPPKLTPKELQKRADDLYVDTEKKFNELLRLNGKLNEELDIAAKAEWARREGNVPLARGDQKDGKWSRDRLRELADIPDDFLAELENSNAVKTKSGDAAKVANLRKQVNGQIDELYKIQDARTLTQGDLHIAFDQIKRDADRVRGAANDRNSNYLFKALSPRVDALRSNLMNEGVGNALLDAAPWPEALASGQRLSNGTWSTSISASTDSELKGAFGQVGEHAEWNPFDNPERLNSGYTEHLLNNVGFPQTAQKRGAVERLIDARADDWVTRSKVYGHEEMAKVAGEFQQLSNELKGNFSTAAEINLAKREASFPQVTAAAAAVEDEALAGMIGKSGKFDPRAPMVPIERTKPDWLKNHLRNRGTEVEGVRAEALDRMLDEEALEAAKLASKVGDEKSLAMARKLTRVRGKIQAQLDAVDGLNQIQRTPPPQWDAVAAAESDAALQGMLGRSGADVGAEAAIDQPLRFNAKWIEGRVANAGSDVEAQNAEAFTNWLNQRVQKAEDIAFERGTDEAAKEAFRIAELRDKALATLGKTADANRGLTAAEIALREAQDNLTPAAASRKDASVQGLIVTDGNVSKAVAADDLPEKISERALFSMLQRIGKTAEGDAEIAVLNLLNTHADEALDMARANPAFVKQAERADLLRRKIKNNIDQVAQRNFSERPARTGQPIFETSARAIDKVKDTVAWVVHRNTLKSLERVDAAAKLDFLVSRALPKKHLTEIGPSFQVPGSTTSTKAIRPAIKAASELGKEVDGFINDLFDDQDPQKQQLQQEQRQFIEKSLGPDVAQAAEQQKQMTRAFLEQKAGGPPSDPASAARMKRYAPAAMKPLDAIDRMADGTATQEDRETVQALSPSLFNRFATKALETVSTIETTYDERLKISRAIGVNVEPTLEPQRVAQLQQLAGSNPSAPQEMGAPSDQVLTPSRQREPRMANVLER